MRVLHLEDNPDDALLVQRAMQRSGLALEVIHAPSLTEYVSAVEAGGFDLIVADHGLPGFSGRAALDLARAKCPRVPFLIVSRADESEVMASLNAGATDFLTKPFRDQDMLDAVATATERDRKRRSDERLVSDIRVLFLASGRS